MPEISPSVLIIRLDAIGDALALTPSLAALRRRAIPVDVVLRSENSGIFASHALRSAIVATFELRSSSRANIAAIERLGRALRSRSYSHVAVATEDPGGYRLAAVVGAPLRIGFEDWRTKPLKALWSRRFLTRSVYRSARLTQRTAHECATLFRLIAPLAGDEAPTRDVTQLRPFLLEAEAAPDERIVVQITDKWERLGIAFDQVVALVRRLRGSGTLRLVSSRAEAGYAQRIANATGSLIEYFDDLGAWKAAIGAAPALVAPDSGALHVAGMVGTPVVGVFANQPLFEAQVARWTPWAAPHRIVRADRDWPARASDALAQLL